MSKKKRDSPKRSYLGRAREWFHHGCRMIVGTAILVGAIWIAVDVVLYFSTSRDFKVREIVISGTHWASPEEIRQLAEIRTGTNIWFVPSVRVAQRIARHPWVRSCRVVKVPPDRVSILVEERRPVCAILERRQGVLYGLDAEGVVLPALFSPHLEPQETIDPKRLATACRLPFLTGPASVLVPGRVVDDSRYLTVLSLLLKLRDISPTFVDHIDSVCVLEEGWIEMFPTQRAKRILFSPSISNTLPRLVVTVWNLIDREDVDVEYIDARFPRVGVVLRPKHLDPNRWFELCRRNNQAV